MSEGQGTVIDDADPSPERSRWRPALAGLLAAAAALGVAELIAGLTTALRSPVISVGDAVIRLAPAGVKQFAIAVFGQADKPALLIGIVILLALYAAGVGVIGARSRLLGVLGIGGFALLGAVAATSGYQASLVATLPSLAGGLVAIGVLVWLLSALPEPGGAGVGSDEAPAEDQPEAVDPGGRRRFLQLSGGVAAASLLAVLGGQLLARRLALTDVRNQLALPEPVRRLSLPIPDAAHPDVEGLVPFVTPNDEFYRIDTALTVPRVDPTSHRVAVTGMVDNELDIAFDQLLTREMIEIPITLTCVSNEVGGDLIDTAVWRGVRLREVLDEAGVDSAATQIVGRSVDGYTCGFPVEAAYDREALIAVGMNGEPLPLEHGFPVRLVVPGLYGYVSATKWLQEIELTTFEAFEQYWVPRGWAEQAPIKTSSKINVPQGLASLEPGPQVVAGVAWAQPRGIETVEVQVDDGPWREATLANEVSDVTWRQWTYQWEATPGRHSLTVRATDETGQVQTRERTAPKPSGSTGWHNIIVTVNDA